MMSLRAIGLWRRSSLVWSKQSLAAQICLLSVFLASSGCVTIDHQQRSASRNDHAFDFATDTLAYPNELIREYLTHAATATMTSRRREPPPEYALHCFVMARATRQFFDYAKFDPALPKVDDREYRRLIRRIIFGSRNSEMNRNRTVVPGYASLREFSRDKESILKDECGGRWRSYFQRGNWRMVFPFTRRHQADQAEQFEEALSDGRLPIVHLVRFPELTINHAALLYAAERSQGAVTFSAYDPNDPSKPARLRFDQATNSFSMPPNAYFHGGRVDVYEVYRGIFF